MDNVKFICVKKFQKKIDAEMARGMLASNGISSYIHAVDIPAMTRFQEFNESIQLMIKSTDQKKAEQLMKLHNYL